MARKPLVLATIKENALVSELRFRVWDSQLQHIEFLGKDLPEVPETGWYIKSVRPATDPEKKLWGRLLVGTARENYG